MDRTMRALGVRFRNGHVVMERFALGEWMV